MVTESLKYSQNHRLSMFGRDVWRSSSPTLLLKQVHPEYIPQDCIQAGFEYLQEGKLHNLSEQPIPVF